MEYVLFLPQMRMSMDVLVERAQAAEAAGFVGIAGMDHLAPPMAFDHTMYDAFVTATWQAAHTTSLKVGSLVLCDAFRHPAVLARECVSLDHASGGRFELGIGWGSVVDEFLTFGVKPTEPRDRVARLKETLEVVTALWSGETVDYTGEYHHLTGARQVPTPLDRIPIVIGGVGRKTLELVATYADWWNVHIGHIHRVEELRPQVGKARPSIQQMVGFIPDEASRTEITELAMKRFGHSNPVVGDAAELVDHYGRVAEQGVERVYVWFTDFARPETVAAFGDGVIRQG